MRRVVAFGLPVAAGVGLVGYLFFPVLGCVTHCFVDPLAVRGPGLGHIEQPDLRLNAWILAWVQHALLGGDPTGLFDANAFHPAPAVLTQSEHMLGIATWLLPLRMFSSDAVWLHQAALIGSSLLLVLSTWTLVRWLTGSFWAGLAAGAAALFMPWRLTELAHVQLLNVQWLPWIWWSLGRIAEAPGRRRDGVVLGVALAFQLLSSFYLAYFLMLSCAALLLGIALVRGIPRAAWRQIAMASALPFAAFVAMALPYVAWSRTTGFHAVDTLFDSLSPAELLRYTLPDPLSWMRALPQPTRFSVPLVVAGLGLAGLLAVRRDHGGAREPRQRSFALGLLLACVGAGVLALGRRLSVGDVSLPLPGSLAAAIVPGFENLRNPLRFAIVIGVAAPVLAGIGFARLEAWAPSPRARAAVRTALLVLLATNVVTPPLPAADAWHGDRDRIVLYETLSRLPPGPLLEIPWPLQKEHDAIHAAQAMLGSTLHWLPLLNGHSGYAPPTYPFLRQAGQSLPSAEGFARLEALVGVRYLLVHRDALPPEQRRAWSDAARDAPLRPVLARGPHVLFEVPGWRDAGLYRDAVASPEPRPRTLAGHPRTPLPETAQRGEIALGIPGPFHLAGLRRIPKPVTLRIANRGERIWPGLDPDPEGLVRLRTRFFGPDGRVVLDESHALVADLAPGETSLVVPVSPPDRPGRYRLRAELVQRRGDAEPVLRVPAVEEAVDVRALPEG